MKVRKRSNKFEDLNPKKIRASISKAFAASGEQEKDGCFDRVMEILRDKGDNLDTNIIGDTIEKVLMEFGCYNTAKKFILYRMQKRESQQFPVLDDWGISKNALQVLKERCLYGDETPLGMLRRVSRYFGTNKREQELFYNLFVEMRGLPNSPALANAGTPMHLYSACFCLPVEDSLEGIFETLKKAVVIHKYGGGTGFDFSNLREKDAPISGSSQGSSGLLSWIRIYNAATTEIKQGGRRRGANMACLNYTHPDILDFIIMKENENVSSFNFSVMVDNNFMYALEDNDYVNLISPHSKGVVRKVKAQQIFNLICYEAWKSGDPGMLFYDRINEDNYVGDKPITMTNPCVSGNTLIKTTQGYKKIKDLVSEEDVWVLSHNYVTGKDAYHRAYNIRKTRENTSVVKVVLTNYAVFTVTPDHKFYLKNGQLKEAKELVSGDYLKGDDNIYYKVKHVISGNRKEDVYNMTVSGTHNYYIVSDADFIGNRHLVLTKNCGESPLLPWESCNLGSLNLAKYENDDQLRESASVMTLLLNRIIDKNRLPYKELQRAMKRFRKIGIGVMGFGDYCLKHNLVYGSDESVRELRRLLSIIRDEAHEISCNLEYPKVYNGRSNANLMSIAPTGTLSTICNCTSGIEPPFGWMYERRILDGSVLIEVNQVFKERFPDLDQETIEQIKRDSSIANIDVFSKDEKKVFRIAFEIPAIEHLKIQAAAQEIVDLGVSKTINLYESATVDEVKDIYTKAWKMRCKGITIYRNNSRRDQPISWDFDLSCKSGTCSI